MFRKRPGEERMTWKHVIVLLSHLFNESLKLSPEQPTCCGFLLQAFSLLPNLNLKLC